MRILIVNTRHYPGGGDSTYAFNLAELLRANDHDVSFFAMQAGNNLPDKNSDLFVSEIDYREMNRRKSPLTAVQVAWRSIYSVEARRKFSALLERVKPDIVHLQNIHAHITPSVIFEAKKRNIPVAWTLHDYKLVCPNSHFLIDQTGEICEACRGGQFWQATHRRCKKGSLLASGMASLEAYVHQWMRVSANVNVFLCPSAFLRSRLLVNGFAENKTLHLPLFLPGGLFEPSVEEDGYFLFLGKLEGIKGIYPLIEAARLAPQIRVILAGRAEESLLQRIPDLLPSNVRYVGFKSGEELSSLRRRARAFVLPSLWYENQPFSILEAFALGKPVIASDLGGMRELVGDDERGLLTPAGEPDALASAMIRLHENPADAHQAGARAYQYVLENHSAQKHYQGLLAIYQDILG